MGKENGKVSTVTKSNNTATPKANLRTASVQITAASSKGSGFKNVLAGRPFNIRRSG